MHVTPDDCPSHYLLKGMYVRVPVDIEYPDHDYRDYRIAQVESFNDVAQTVQVRFYRHSFDQQVPSDLRSYNLKDVNRCHILPDTRFVHASTKQRGRILCACCDDWAAGKLCEYYVQLDGKTQRLSEADVLVSVSRQDPDPIEQLRSYEFHNPTWKLVRDGLIKSYYQLRNATFGLEDLVGSRIMLLAHQAEVIATVLGDTQCRYILADEVGLGKTIEACVILKGLSRRHPQLRTLIVAPASLVQQWHNELDSKFWLDLPVVGSDGAATIGTQSGARGWIVSTDDLAEDPALWSSVQSQHWDLLITDEAHHLRKNPTLHERLRILSRQTDRVLILSATPIQRRAAEYLALLQVLDPMRYEHVGNLAFQRILRAQDKIRRTIAYLTPDMTPDRFDRDAFEKEIAPVVEDLADDTVLADLVKQVRSGGLGAAQDVLAYVSENYRIESRVIRNRRLHLQVPLPQRTLDTSYSYAPGLEECATLEALYDYVQTLLRAEPDDLLTLEYGRVILHAAGSSPYALAVVLELRAAHLASRTVPSHSTMDLTVPAAPRQEWDRIQQLVATVPSHIDETGLLENMLWLTGRWRAATDAALREALQFAKNADRLAKPSPHRLVELVRALCKAMNETPNTKVVVFATWWTTLATLLQPLEQMFGRGVVVPFHAGMTAMELQMAVDLFQAEAGCGILLCDELGGEGRNFQMADHIIHADLPWTPAQVEQRIGRVDRLGRSGTVRSVVLFAQDSLDDALFHIWQDAFHLFTESMSGLEIALEGIQTELITSLKTSVRDGISGLHEQMMRQAEDLREVVEEERYFEEGAINRRRREEFAVTEARYRDGKLLRTTFLRWADLAGLRHDYDPIGDILTFDPRDFNFASMQNAKMFQLPNMEDAFRRALHSRTPSITGTFNRDIAVRREDLVFFAPGTDAWTDAIVANALEADRGRCCAIYRKASELPSDWCGFELLYSLTVDPRSLYEAGADPIHLFRAQGYLMTDTYRLLISRNGQIIKANSPIVAVVDRPFDKSRDVHLGKRDGPAARIKGFKDAYHPDVWNPLLQRVFAVAEAKLDEELSFMPEEAQDAQRDFVQRAMGWKASDRWRQQELAGMAATADIAEYERASDALVAGLARPLRRLESVCFWVLRSGKAQ